MSERNMINNKKAEFLNLFYIVTFLVALFSNINIIAEAPVKPYNYVVTALFLAAKILFCLSRENNRYSVWINLAVFIASVYVMIFIDNASVKFIFSLAMVLYLPVFVPYAPIIIFIYNITGSLLVSSIAMHFVFLGVSVIISLIYKKQNKACADQKEGG